MANYVCMISGKNSESKYKICHEKVSRKSELMFIILLPLTDKRQMSYFTSPVAGKTMYHFWSHITLLHFWRLVFKLMALLYNKLQQKWSWFNCMQQRKIQVLYVLKVTVFCICFSVFLLTNMCRQITWFSPFTAEIK